MYIDPELRKISLAIRSISAILAGKNGSKELNLLVKHIQLEATRDGWDVESVTSYILQDIRSLGVYTPDQIDSAKKKILELSRNSNGWIKCIKLS